MLRDAFSCDGTIGNYPVFRRAMPDFSVRTCVLLPRLPVYFDCSQYPLTCMPYPRRQRSP